MCCRSQMKRLGSSVAQRLVVRLNEGHPDPDCQRKRTARSTSCFHTAGRLNSKSQRAVNLRCLRAYRKRVAHPCRRRLRFEPGTFDTAGQAVSEWFFQSVSHLAIAMQLAYPSPRAVRGLLFSNRFIPQLPQSTRPALKARFLRALQTQLALECFDH